MTVEIDLKGAVSLITGAGKGIGAACARRLAQCGSDVILISRTKSDLDKIAQDVRSFGVKAFTIVCDAETPDAVQKAVSDSLNEFGKIDILINNAAVNIREKALDVSLDNWNKIIQVNLRGYFVFAQAVGRHMVAKGHGCIVNVTSELSIVGSASGQVAYSASKGGINQLTRTLAAEWAQYGIRVNAVAPCLTVTPLVEKLLQNEEYRQRAINEIPLKRFAKPDDIANAVLFLSSQLSSFITGHILVVDGGYTIV